MLYNRLGQGCVVRSRPHELLTDLSPVWRQTTDVWNRTVLLKPRPESPCLIDLSLVPSILPLGLVATKNLQSHPSISKRRLIISALRLWETNVGDDTPRKLKTRDWDQDLLGKWILLVMNVAQSAFAAL